jgi:D-sedoheptulose 7-phosphate isomerase
MGGDRMRTLINYAEEIYNATAKATCGDLFANEAVDLLAHRLKNIERVFMIGNGGSGAACDHMANDLCLAGVKAQSLTNTNNITCIANDFGFENIFAKQLEWLLIHQGSNMLIAFSCSGKSPNILKAIEVARRHRMYVVTFSGFAKHNPLAAAGDMNFHVPSHSYGVVQLAHEALIHCAIDKIAGHF